MNETSKSDDFLTYEAYLALEESSHLRYEFHQGKVYARAGTTDKHNEIVNNILEKARPFFKKRNCKVYSESIKVELKNEESYVYPDLFVTCEEEDKESTYVKRFPSIVVEVLSKSTAEYDLTTKFEKYQQSSTLQYYLLVESRWVSVILYSRTQNPDIWTYQYFNKPTDTVEFPAFGFSLPLAKIYEDINFYLHLAEPETRYGLNIEE